MTQCIMCEVVIPPINLEFGGHHIWISMPDGPVVCGRGCQRAYNVSRGTHLPKPKPKPLTRLELIMQEDP